MFLTIKIKIVAALAAIVGLVAWFLLFLLSGQYEIAEINDKILKDNVQAIKIADDLKHNVVLYDDRIFRYIATDDPASLEEARRTQGIVSQTIALMEKSVTSETEKKLLIELKKEIRIYYLQVENLLRGFKSVGRKKDILNLLVQADKDAAGRALPKLDQEHSVALLTAEGSARLTRIYTSCEKLVDINRSRLEEAKGNIERIMQDSKDSTFTFGAIVAGVILLVMLALAYSIIAPISGLLKGVKKVAEGDLDLEIPITSGDEVGKLTQAFNSMTRKLKDEHHKLLTQTITDQLTGIYNFRYFQEFLTNELSRATRYQAPFSMVLMDIDHFKQYNDANGHEMGNVILKDVAAIIKETLRKEDFLARYGGEEFIVILPETPLEGGRKVAERIRVSVEKSEFPSGEKQPGGRLTVSIGGTSYPARGDFSRSVIPKQLIEEADQSLYEAKRKGRNKVVWHTELK